MLHSSLEKPCCIVPLTNPYCTVPFKVRPTQLEFFFLTSFVIPGLLKHQFSCQKSIHPPGINEAVSSIDAHPSHHRRHTIRKLERAQAMGVLGLLAAKKQAARYEIFQANGHHQLDVVSYICRELILQHTNL